MVTKKLQLVESLFPPNPQAGQVLSIDENDNMVWAQLSAENVDGLDEAIVQSDWNQNDETQPDYVKNRTHWDNGESEIIVLSEWNVPFEEYEDGSIPQVMYWYEIEKKYVKAALVEGKTYSVVVNNIVYECDSWYYPPLDCVCLGNVGYLNESYHGNDDPFVIYYTDGMLKALIINGKYALSISTKECNFQQLDPRYVKDMYYADTDAIYTSLVGSLSMDFASCDLFNGDTELSGYIYETLQLESTITVGQEYIVEFDTVNYPCTAVMEAWKYDIVIGNGAFVDKHHEDNGLPFAICISSDTDTLAHVIVGDQNEHHFYILSKGPLIHQIPECYIPKSILSGKANVSDLTALETSISNTNNAVAGKADLNHNHDSSYDSKGSADTALASAKTYTDAKVAALVDSAPETMDTLNELAAVISEHQEVTDALDAAITSKASADHNHDDVYYTETEVDTLLANLDYMVDVPVTVSDAGKFLRVSSEGVWVAEKIPNAEEETF